MVRKTKEKWERLGKKYVDVRESGRDSRRENRKGGRDREKNT